MFLAAKISVSRNKNLRTFVTTVPRYFQRAIIPVKHAAVMMTTA